MKQVLALAITCTIFCACNNHTETAAKPDLLKANLDTTAKPGEIGRAHV